MNVRNVAQRMLKMSGINSVDTTTPGDIALLDRVLVSSDLDDCVVEINAALQEVFDYAPAEVSERPVGIVLYPPQSVTLTVTQYSQTISALTTYNARQIGCTIRIPGDTRDNELTSQTTLLRPYMGASASGASAMIYHDAAPLDSTIKSIIDPIEITPSSGIPFLRLASTEQEFRCFNGTFPQYGLRDVAGGQGATYTTEFNKTISTPLVGYVNSRYVATAANLQRFIRVNPMPDRAYSLTGRSKLFPPVFTTADITAGSTPDILIPSEWVESILLPFCKQRWTSHQSCILNEDQKREIGRQFENAKNELDRMNPLIASTTGFYGP